MLTTGAARTARRGFTLIEVMLVVVITGMLMYAMGLIFKGAAGIVGITEAEMETRQKARNIFSRLESDLQGVVISEQRERFNVRKLIQKIDGRDCVFGGLLFSTATKYNPAGMMSKLDLNLVEYGLLDEAGAKDLKKRKKLPDYDPESPLLMRYSITYVSKDAAAAFNSAYPDEPKLKACEHVDVGKMGPYGFGQYADIIAGKVYDFSVDYIVPRKVYGLGDFTLPVIDSYWESAGGSLQPPPGPLPPQAVRVSISLRDSKDRLERTFETIIRPKLTRFE